MSAGALELLQRGELPADFWDWECGAAFRFARDEGTDEGAAGRASSRARWALNSPSAGTCWQNFLHESLTAAVSGWGADDLDLICATPFSSSYSTSYHLRCQGLAAIEVDCSCWHINIFVKKR